MYYYVIKYTCFILLVNSILLKYIYSCLVIIFILNVLFYFILMYIL